MPPETEKKAACPHGGEAAYRVLLRKKINVSGWSLFWRMASYSPFDRKISVPLT